MAGKQVRCDEKGRRLHEAPDKIDDVTGNMITWANTRTLANSEGDEKLMRDARFVCRRVVAEVRLKFEFIYEPPCAFSNVTIPTWAANILRFWRSEAVQHPKTRSVMLVYEDDLELISAGDTNNVPDGLVKLQRQFR